MNKTRYHRIITLITLTFFITTVLTFGMALPVHTDKQSLNGSFLNTQDFSAQDFEPLIDYTEQIRGVVSASDMEINELGLGFYTSNEHPELIDDYSNGALNLSYVDTEFISTTSPAYRNRGDSNEVVEKSQITVLLNESVNVEFNKTKSPEGYLVYRSLLTPTRIMNLHVNSTVGFEEVEDLYYDINEDDFLVFDYGQHYDGIDELNLTMYLTLEYNLTMNNWELEQVNTNDIIITQQEQAIETQYNYRFRIIGYQLNDSLEETIRSSKISVNLTVSPPNKDLLRDYDLEIDGDSKQTSKYLNPDDSFSTGFIPVNQSSIFSFSLDFTVDFNISFYESVTGFWSIDRLTENRNTRQRIYFPTISSGPSDIYVENVKFFERTISFNQNVSASSQFGREVSIKNASVEDWEENPRYKSSNWLEKWGLNVTLPLMILGEICPISIEYIPTQNLRVKVTDNIGMPVSGLNVIVYYGGKAYGSYISQNTSQPISSQTTDIRSEIFIGDVPNGYYTIDVYLYGIHQGTYDVNSYKTLNLISTPIIHFPYWLIIFGIFSIALIGMGYILYKKNKRIALT